MSLVEGRAKQVMLIMKTALLNKGSFTLKDLTHIVSQPSYIVNHMVGLGYVEKASRGNYKFKIPITWDNIIQVSNYIAYNWHKSLHRELSALASYTDKELIAELERRGVYMIRIRK